MLDEKTSVTADYHLDESSCSSDSEMDECASEATQAELEGHGMQFQAKLKAVHKVHGGIPRVNYKEPTVTLACNHQEPTAQPATEQDIEKHQAVPVQRGVVVNTVSADMQLGMTSTKIPDPQRYSSSESSESSDSDVEDQEREPSPWQLAYNAFDNIVMEYKTKLTADLVAKQQEYIASIVASDKLLTVNVADKYLDLTMLFTAKQHELAAQYKATTQELKEHKAVMVSHDALIVKLHNDVSERDALIAKLHNDIAERDGLFVKHSRHEGRPVSKQDTSLRRIR